MSDKYIPLSVPNFSGNELKYVTKAIEEEWVSTGGEYINEFERKICAYTGAKYAVACQSGTAGLHLALMAAGVREEDEVFVPSLTFVAAVNPVAYVGAKPVFFDCDDKLTIDTAQVKRYLGEHCIIQDNCTVDKTTGRVVRAMVVVHVFGNIADMESLLALAKEHHIKVIEDATESLGTKYISGPLNGKYAGTIGDIGVYSFNGNKIITTGGGGMVVTDDEQVAKLCRHMSTQAKADAIYFDHDMIGYNYRMTNLQAALGLAQLEQLEKFIKIKEQHYALYKSLGVGLYAVRDGIRSNYWFYNHKTSDRDGLIRYLAEKNIQSRPIWKLIHTLAPYRNEITAGINKANDIVKKTVSIPCSTNLTDEDVYTVASVIKRYESNGT